ncbi:hypothetical protein JCM10135_12230 [Stetteria hydrogenophila]
MSRTPEAPRTPVSLPEGAVKTYTRLHFQALNDAAQSILKGFPLGEAGSPVHAGINTPLTAGLGGPSALGLGGVDLEGGAGGWVHLQV